ncbi:MAG: FAD-dependent oxidoreductase [Pirellulaceae bacterium]|nr:FAD-dependent oxidoreductase [Pirellulaceae bacterium]
MKAPALERVGADFPTLAVVGGGLAGMAAAWTAAERGFRVELFERAKTLGGRAGSFVDPKTGATTDYCQHAAMGCCTALLDFCRRAGIDDCFQRTDRLHFIGPDGRRCDAAPSRLLPAPLHLLPGLAKLRYLTPGERLKIARALRQLTKSKNNSRGLTAPGEETRNPSISRRLLAAGYCPDDGLCCDDDLDCEDVGSEPVGDWLRRHGQSQQAIDRFWSPVLVGALAETVDHASLTAARKVFRDGFLASRDASDLLLPRAPLAEIFNERLGRRLAERGVEVHLKSLVRRIEGDRRSAHAIVLADGRRREFGFVIVAVPWRKVRSLLADELNAAMPALESVEKIAPAAITAVHLWFDRPVVPLPHAVLIGQLSQWVFAERQNDSAAVQHCQVVISAYHRMERRTHDELLYKVLGELRAVWPAVGEAELLHRRVIVQPAAVFSCLPGANRFRPLQRTPVPNLALAGDWTATGWPGTMEGAVRSGALAVEALHDAV